MNKPVLRCENLVKTYQDGKKHHTEVLREINFEVLPKQSVAIVGSSGSGKSTLLHLLGGLDKPTRGNIYWQEKEISYFNEAKRCALRNQQLGFVYQFHHLLPEFNALENVAMPLLIRGDEPKAAEKQAHELLDKVGLAKRVQHKVGELSGGERQRVAIARALVTKPSCVLADEPTGNLDKTTAEQVFEVILQLQKEFATSFIIVTHDLHLADKMQLKYQLLDGKLDRIGDGG